MKKRKKFTTKKNIKWKMIDTIVLGIILIISISGIVMNADRWIEQFSNSNGILGYIFIVILLIFGIILSTLPYLIVYFALRYAIIKYNKSIVTFDVIEDLEYYREKFNGISPATMSLLMDLNLETNKDLGAMKLYYELNDIYIYVLDGKMDINNPNNIKLYNSDKILLKYFFDNKKQQDTLNEWKENVICENVNNNLIIRKNNKDKKNVGCLIFITLHILSLLYMGFYFFNANKYIDIIDTILDNAKTNEEIFNLLSSNPNYMSCFFLSLILVISLLTYFWSIIGGIIHFVIGSAVSVKDNIKRTKEGNELAEKLYGMKNFINDFSNLDEATKKHLVLWEDFLIYAVVLEENDKILSEISDIYHTDLLKYKNYNN